MAVAVSVVVVLVVVVVVAVVVVGGCCGWGGCKWLLVVICGCGGCGAAADGEKCASVCPITHTHAC